MNLKNALIKIFNLEKGEEKIVLLIIIYSFFMGAAIAFFVSSATSLFLSQFKREMLPLAFIASGIIVYLIGTVFSKLQANIKFSRLINYAISFLFISSGIFLVFYLLGAAAWIVFILYAWIRVFAYIHSVTFWGIASKLFSLRQGKRVFGLIGSGEVIASIISFFSVPILLTFLQTEDLLIIASVCLIISFLLMFVIVKKNKIKLSEIKKPKSESIDKNTEKQKISFFQNKYFSIIFFIALFPIIGQLLVEFIFQAQSKIQFPQKEALTGFLGIFFGFTSIIEFVLKTFLSGRLISRYGIRLGLIIFPLLLVISFLFAALSGTFDATISLFFPFVALGRLFTRAARTSFNDPSTQILFQPIPAEIRLAFQSKIEGGPKAFGNIIAGVIILLLSYLSFLNLVHFSYILLGLVVFWLKFAFDAYKEYKKTIQDVLNTDKLISESEDLQISENINCIKDNLITENIDVFYKNIILIQKIEPYFVESYLTVVYFNSDDRIKQLIINQLISNINLKEMKNLLDNIYEKNLEINSQNYLLLKEKYDYYSNISFEEIISSSESSDENKRVEAAHLLRFSKRYNSFKYILNLLNDKNYFVKSAAIIAAGENRNPDLWLKLIELLQNEHFKNYAISSIIFIGDPILNELEKYFNKNINNAENQSVVIYIMSLIGTKKAISILRKHIKNQHINIKKALVSGLYNLGYLSAKTETPYLNKEIEDIIEFIVWIAAAIEDVRLSNSEYLVEALDEEFSQKNRDLFNFLSIIYGKNNIDAVKTNLTSREGDNKGYALEILDMIFPEETKNLLLPLFENNTTFEILNAYKLMFPQIKMSYNQRLIDIVNKDYTKLNLWVKALALKYLAEEYNLENERNIISNIPNPNLILKEIAAESLYIFDNEKLLDQLVKLKPEDKINYQSLKIKIDKVKENNNLFVFEKVAILKQLEIFHEINSSDLICIAENSNDFYIKQNQELNLNLNRQLLLVLNGEIEIKTYNNVKKYNKNMLIDFSSSENNNSLYVKSIDNSHILLIDYNKLLVQMQRNSTLLRNFLDYNKSSVL
jgi:ATP/ADP translocase/HEAT repeat protein